MLSVLDGRNYGMLGWGFDPGTGTPVSTRVRLNGNVVRAGGSNYRWDDMPSHTGVNSNEAVLFLAQLRPGENTICLDGFDASAGGWTQLGCRTHTVK